MSKLERITITLPEEMAARIAAAVESGEYATASEVVRDALRRWNEKQERRAAALAQLRAEIEEGLAGPFCDGEAFFNELEAEIRRTIEDMPDAA